MILERVVYFLGAALLFAWAVASVRSGEIRPYLITYKWSDAPFMFSMSVAITAFFGAFLAWQVINPQPLSWFLCSFKGFSCP
jgi:hypothetical protein